MAFSLEQRIALIDANPLLKALSDICDLGTCGGKGGFQKAIDIASGAIDAELAEPSSELVSFAERELALVGPVYDGMVNAAALEIVRIFARQGHSGGSAALVTEMVERLMRFEPLTHLTGNDDEWNEVGEAQWQNQRCPHVFKNRERAWDIDLPVTGLPGWRTIQFPYLPRRAA